MKKIATLLLLFMFVASSQHQVQAEVCYVTDAGGVAYDDCRTCVNLAPAVAITTVIVVAIIALAVQNCHHHHSHCSGSSHSSSSSSSSYCHCE